MDVDAVMHLEADDEIRICLERLSASSPGKQLKGGAEERTLDLSTFPTKILDPSIRTGTIKLMK